MQRMIQRRAAQHVFHRTLTRNRAGDALETARRRIESSVVAQPDFVAYSATKAALLQMTRNMALDLAPFRIRVNAVCPGTIMTQATERHRVQAGLSMEEFLAQEGPKHLVNRVGQPREVAEAILVLASDAASFITGTHLMVDGGYTAR